MSSRENFFGLIKAKIGGTTTSTMQKLSLNNPSLHIQELVFRLSQTVNAGRLYGSLEHEDRKILATQSH